MGNLVALGLGPWNLNKCSCKIDTLLVGFSSKVKQKGHLPVSIIAGEAGDNLLFKSWLNFITSIFRYLVFVGTLDKDNGIGDILGGLIIWDKFADCRVLLTLIPDFFPWYFRPLDTDRHLLTKPLCCKLQFLILTLSSFIFRWLIFWV